MSNNKNKTKSLSAFHGADIAAYRLSALVESADDAIISKTLDGIITSWNKGAERIFGYTEEETIGKPVLILIPPELQNEEPVILKKIRAGERIEHYETVRRTKNGRLIDISLTVSPIKDSDGKIIGASKIARDITHLKQAEERLRASEESYRRLFNSIDEGFCVIQMLFDDSGKPVDYRFLEINPAFEEQTGLVAAEGKTMRELAPNLDESWFEIYGKVAATGESIRFENRAEVLDRWFDLYAFRIGEPESRKVAVLFKNITERKQTEEELRESREMLRLAMSSSGMGAWSRDLVRDKVVWSEALEAIFGLPAGTFSGTIDGFYDYVLPADRERIKNEIWKALDQYKDYTIEFRFQHADGSLRWMEGRGRAVYAADGKPTKVYGIGIDITERKRAEEDLRKSDARLRLALDIAQTSAFEIDLVTDKVETDEIGREMYGFEKDEPLTFAKVQSHFHPDDRDYVAQSVTAALEPSGSDEFEVEQRIIRTDGEIRWIRVRGRAFFEGEGEARSAVTCLGTYIDITERKEAEEEREQLLKQLEAERSRLQYLFTNAPAFVATLRGPEHVFELTNPAYLQLIGHRNVVGKPVREALPEIEGQGFFQLLDKVFETGESYVGSEIPFHLQRAPAENLEERFVDFVYQPIFETGNRVSGIFVHGIDITEQVQARRDAESANRAKDEFLATLSHELRTPLNAILGWSRMMNDSELDEDIQKRALETIQRNARVQSQLIDDILDVSRIISGKLKLEVSPVELSAVIESAIESVLPAAQAKEIRLQRVLDSGNGLISGDPNRLQQII